MPCDFCKTKNIREPCFKLFGPKTDARLNPSRPIPTAIDAVIEPEDVLLLQYAYSRQLDDFYSLIVTRLPFIYGQSLSSPSLRHAVLAWAAMEIGFPQYRRHKSQMYQELAAKIKDPALITETDIFASFLFMCGTKFTSEENLKHAKGCLSMMRALLDEIQKGKHVSDFFSACAPLLYELVNIFLKTENLRDVKKVQFPKWILCPEGGILKGIDALAGFDISQKCIPQNSVIADLAMIPMVNVFFSLLEIMLYKVHCERLDILGWTPSMEGVVQTVSQHLRDPEYLVAYDAFLPLCDKDLSCIW